jgi:hypothetical protein
MKRLAKTKTKKPPIEYCKCDYCGEKFDSSLKNEQASHDDFCVCPEKGCLEAHGHYMQSVGRDEPFLLEVEPKPTEMHITGTFTIGGMVFGGDPKRRAALAKAFLAAQKQLQKASDRQERVKERLCKDHHRF